MLLETVQNTSELERANGNSLVADIEIIFRDLGRSHGTGTADEHCDFVNNVQSCHVLNMTAVLFLL
jgi:hypothetical protein